MRYMLDTNMLIYVLKNQPPRVAERMSAMGANDELCMSFVTWAELLRGLEGSSRKPQTAQAYEAIAQVVPVRYAATHELCAHHATHAHALKTAGQTIAANDLWIAAHALADDCTLVTNNTREFERVKGLRIENWAV